MAATVQAVISVSIADGQGFRAPATAYVLVDPTATLNTILTGLDGYITAIDAVTEGNIIDATLKLVIPQAVNGGKSGGVADSQVQSTGVFDYFSTGNTKRWGHAIPTFDSSYVSNNAINNAAANVAALISLMDTPAASFTYTDERGLQLTLFSKSFPTNRKHRHPRR